MHALAGLAITVLVVDSDAASRQACRAPFRALRPGWRVLEAPTAATARGQLLENHCHLAVCDPAVGGSPEGGLWREVLQAFGVPVVLRLGPHAGEVEYALGLELGADDCWGPGVGPREMVARVEAVLRRRYVPSPAR